MVDLSETKLNKQNVNYVSTLQTPTKKFLDMIVKNGEVLDVIEPKTNILTIIYFFKLSSSTVYLSNKCVYERYQLLGMCPIDINVPSKR